MMNAFERKIQRFQIGNHKNLDWKIDHSQKIKVKKWRIRGKKIKNEHQ